MYGWIVWTAIIVTTGIAVWTTIFDYWSKMRKLERAYLVFLLLASSFVASTAKSMVIEDGIGGKIFAISLALLYTSGVVLNTVLIRYRIQGKEFSLKKTFQVFFDWITNWWILVVAFVALIIGVTTLAIIWGLMAAVVGMAMVVIIVGAIIALDS